MAKLKCYNGRGWRPIRVKFEERVNYPNRVEYAYVLAASRKRASELLKEAVPPHGVSMHELTHYWSIGSKPDHLPEEEGVWVDRDELGRDKIERIL